MRLPFSFHVLSASVAMTLLVGCAGGGTTAIAPKIEAPRQSEINPTARYPIVNHYSCPATGTIRYLSDLVNNAINVYSGKFAGQAPCGQITSDLHSPVGMHVKISTHDLYVANWHGGNILVFHRGETTPYNTYTDPSGQNPSDVTVTNDGTVVATNSGCSLSTWIGGPGGGTFVGTFKKLPCFDTGIVFLTTNNGIVYYVNSRSGRNRSTMWSVSCPAGKCGTRFRVPGVRLGFFPSGVTSDAAGDLLAVDLSGSGRNNRLKTYSPPNPNPTIFNLLPGGPYGIAISDGDHHLFVADISNTDGEEYVYPGGKLIGTVPGNVGGSMVGIAVDP